MLKCTNCGSADEFDVDELCRHTIRIQCNNDWEYTFVEEVKIIDSLSWGDVTCRSCNTTMDSEDARACYDDAQSDDSSDPIPYTLACPGTPSRVDASIS